MILFPFLYFSPTNLESAWPYLQSLSLLQNPNSVTDFSVICKCSKWAAQNKEKNSMKNLIFSHLKASSVIWVKKKKTVSSHLMSYFIIKQVMFAECLVQNFEEILTLISRT